jgi:hypothetical protein
VRLAALHNSAVSLKKGFFDRVEARAIARDIEHPPQRNRTRNSLGGLSRIFCDIERDSTGARVVRGAGVDWFIECSDGLDDPRTGNAALHDLHEICR